MATTTTDSRAGQRGRRQADQMQIDAKARAIPIEQIAQRAYELFMERGGAHGHDVDDWLAAEHELLRTRVSES